MSFSFTQEITEVPAQVHCCLGGHILGWCILLSRKPFPTLYLIFCADVYYVGILEGILEINLRKESFY